jgi:hypothetical protein
MSDIASGLTLAFVDFRGGTGNAAADHHTALSKAKSGVGCMIRLR